jgi:hypothetical protein
MERPDIGKPVIETGSQMRLVARTQDIVEANRIAEQYQLQGFQTKIVKQMQAGLAVYEVWIGKEPEGRTGTL